MNHILGDAACSWGRRGKGYVILKHLLPGCKVMLKGGSVSKGYRGHFEEVSTGQSWIVWESNRWVDTWVRRGSSASWWWTESHHLASIIDGSAVKNPPVSPEDAGSISGWGRSPGGGNGNPLQYSCLRNSMVRGAWPDYISGGLRVKHIWATEQ